MHLNIFEAAMKMETVENNILPGYALKIIDEETGKAMEYRRITKHAKKLIQERWRRLFANDIGNLAQGVSGRVKGTNTIYFIKHKDMPAEQKSTYGCIVVNYFPQKEDPYHKRLTVGRNFIN